MVEEELEPMFLWLKCKLREREGNRWDGKRAMGKCGWPNTSHAMTHDSLWEFGLYGSID